MKKIVRFLLIAIAAIIILVTIGAVYMFGVALDRQTTPTDTQDAYAFVFKDQNVKNWVDSLNSISALRDTLITADDGTKLHALYIKAPADSANTALVIHGYTDNAIRMLMIGRIYSDMGYNVLLPDLRGHGQSEGEYVQMGWKDRLDILRWIDVCNQIYGETGNIAIHGISMGAATTMMTSGQDLPGNVTCFVEDCGFTSVWDEYKYELKKRYGLPAFPILYATSLYSQMKVGWNFKEASALEQIKKHDLPMLFIHGGNDDYVPTQMVYELYEAKPGIKEIWVEEGVDHANMYWMHTDKYIQQTKDFVSKHIEGNQ